MEAIRARLQEGAIIRLTWLSKTKPLYEPDQQEAIKVTKTSTKVVELQKEDTLKEVTAAAPKPTLSKPPRHLQVNQLSSGDHGYFNNCFNTS